ncbi:hypothetical protein [Nocardia sp. AG03]|uniref:hypothetical protein n=1 Tax=Nocardia sp. AG03 TaxID=3025312 RepID=UPI0024189490|nr:hypothetical protein [Nocardia sp. AG03]
MTSQVADVRMTYATRPAADRGPVEVPATALRGIGAVRVLFGLVALGALIAGFDAGTGMAAPVLAIVGAVSIALGLATVATTPRLLRDDRAVLSSVAADAVLVVLGVAALMIGWDQFTVAGAAVVLGGAVIAALSAVSVAVVTALHEGRAA